MKKRLSRYHEARRHIDLLPSIQNALERVALEDCVEDIEIRAGKYQGVSGIEVKEDERGNVHASYRYGGMNYRMRVFLKNTAECVGKNYDKAKETLVALLRGVQINPV